MLPSLRSALCLPLREACRGTYLLAKRAESLAVFATPAIACTVLRMRVSGGDVLQLL